MIFEKNNKQITWESVLDPIQGLSFGANFKVLPTKGNIAWEYNPFRNLRLDLDMYEYNGKLHTKKEYEKDLELGNLTASSNYEELPEGVNLYQKNELVDFITDLLSFDLKHPVNILPAYSYDGSVDLIINDGINLPRLINSRFSTTGMNTYEIINRKGDNDTNIYDMGNQFDVDTSLYKKTNKIPKIEYDGTLPGGSLKIGNYHFYFKYADADGNETDFVAESGLVSIFKGTSAPLSMSTGERDENSLKCVSFQMKNIDSGYLYLHVYYTRSTAENNQNMVTEAVKILQNFLINSNGICNILITGEEEIEKIPLSDINLQYNVVLSSKSLAICQNMLFMANIQKTTIDYEELQDLSLRFLPYLHTKKYDLNMDENYQISSPSKGYYDSKYIYDFTGYWNKDLYRLGIVYIMKDNTLSPVFNIRGRENIKEFTGYNRPINENVNSAAYTKIPVYNSENKRIKINYEETSNLIVKSGNGVERPGNSVFENVKGVVSLDSTLDTDTILGFDIRTTEDTILELKKYVKGFFFVRQRRMPLTLCQGITIGIENNSRLPAIPTVNGVTAIDYLNTFLETRDMNPNLIHYVLEGFLGRYTYTFKRKSSGFWSKVLKAVSVAAIIVAAAVASFYTGGAALIAATTTLSSVLTPTLIGASIIVGSTVVVAGAQSIVLSVLQARHLDETALPFYGRKVSVPKGFKRVEKEDSRRTDASFKLRVILADQEDCKILAMLVPDYTVNPAKYNQLFTGDEFVVEYATSLAITNFSNCGYFLNDNRHFYVPGYRDWNLKNGKNYVSLLSVPDGISAIGIDLTIFRSKAGNPSLANTFELVKKTYKDSTLNTNSEIVRGNFGPYVAMLGFQGPAVSTLTIKIPGYAENNLLNYMTMRMNDHSEYSAISDRIDINDCKNPETRLQNALLSPYFFQLICFRGDCYICQFTQRIIRNLNDGSAPYNEIFVDPKTWLQYDVDSATALTKLNTGDVNSSQLGMWVTFRVRSNYNLNIRTVDESLIAEKLESGHARGYYPYYPMSVDGSYKIPEALVYNLGFSKSLSERYNFEAPDVPYVKNWFGTRIIYSDINITDGYKNGFRTFRGTSYKDYTREYGSITKIVELKGNLIVVFEHGIGFLEVNEKAVAAQSQSGDVYITTNTVLPEKITVLSDAVGSQWADSILKIPMLMGNDNSSVVFGVDTVAKKIWMYDGRSVLCISDFKVQEFLNNNITLGERDLTPIIGIRNVKTLYNAYKQDVMFTFYDCLDGVEEKAWNLCYNLTLGKFITFYSWVPAFMNNIDNIPFSFDRDVVKAISKLGISKIGNDFSDGIVLSRNIIKSDGSEPIIGELTLANRVLPFCDLDNVKYSITYEVVRDNYCNHKLFTVKKIIDKDSKTRHLLVVDGQEKLIDTYVDSNGTYGLQVETDSPIKLLNPDSGVFVLPSSIPENERAAIKNLNSELYYRNIEGNSYSDWRENSNMPEYCSDESKVWTHNMKEQLKINKLSESIEGNYPIFKDRSGRKIMLPEEDRLNQDQIVRFINIRASIKVGLPQNSKSLFDTFKASRELLGEKETEGTPYTWIDCGFYESTVAVTTEWNLQFLTSDFWKHGLAGLIDICDDIKPTIWYGKQHPFEFECIVVNDPSVHKIFQNLEIISNKALPESFHFEIIGDAYDFAKDKETMYFRQEARKALFLYNGLNVTYNKDFLKILPKLSNLSAELVYSYYERKDKLLEIADVYEFLTYNDYYRNWLEQTPNVDYRHLSGAEIVYYKNRNEYRIWQHLPAINIDDLPLDDASSIIKGNCLYIEDRWRISINPLLICYKNEYSRRPGVSGTLFLEVNSNWPYVQSSDPEKPGKTRIPPITIKNTVFPEALKNIIIEKQNNNIEFPFEGTEEVAKGKNNALYGLYFWPNNNYPNAPLPVDNTNWLNDLSIYKTDFGAALNRKETDLRDKFMKVRIRYSGEDLAVIDWLNTIYTISYA